MLSLLKCISRLLWVAGLAAAIIPAGRQSAMADAFSEDQLQRIVSVGGDVTEIIFALGLGDRVVAVDTTSQYPPDAVKEKKSVGYMRALSTEGVLSVAPTLIVASADAGPPEVVAALKGSTVPFVAVKGEGTPEGVVHKIKAIATALGVAGEGEKLASRIEAEFAEAAAQKAKVTKPVRALFVLAQQEGRTVVGGAHTAAGDMFSLAGAVNAVTGFDGYKPLSDEAAITAAPDVIVVMTRNGGVGADNFAQAIGSMRGLASTPAAKSGRIIEVDGSYMLQFGPRAASAALDLMHRFYPELGPASRETAGK